MDLISFLIASLSPTNFMWATVGIVGGVILGVLPGISSTAAIALMLPVTFTMAPVEALIFLGAIYTGSTYGGAYTAILVNTPGTPQNIATTFDGFPMAKRGDGNLAITISCLASVIGGLVGAVALFSFAPPLAEFALSFGPVEYFWLAILGLTLIAALSEGNLLKGAIGGCFGLVISFVGISVVSGDTRFTFDLQPLLGGIHIVPAVIGLLCIPVLMDMVGRSEAHIERSSAGDGFRLREAIDVLRRAWRALARSSVIGTVIGVLPAAGGSIASLVAYSEVKRTSKRRVEFGKGNPEGVIASETANNATVGAGLIPTFVLGIPGTPPDAVILGALMVHGVRTGPTLFTNQPEIIFTFIFGLLLATILMLPVGLIMGRYMYGLIVNIPKTFLVPLVAFFTIVGAYAIQNDVNDVIVMLVLGIFAWVIGRVGFSAPPIVLGLLLGPIAEQGFVQGVLISRATGDMIGQFFGRPVGLIVIAVIVLTLAFPFIARMRSSAKYGGAVSS